MRNRLPFTKLALGVCLLGLASTARGDLRWVEDIAVVPTTSVVELPRTYLVPSTYVTARTYVSPTSVVLPTVTTANVYDVVPTSSYYVPSSYVATRTYRTLRPRRYVETMYVSSYPTTLSPTYYVTPSTYLAPTSFITSTGLIATSANLCCESTAAVSRVAPLPTPPANTNQKAADAYEPRPGASLNNTVGNEPDYRTDVNKPVRDESLNTTRGSTDPQTPTGSVRQTIPGQSSSGRSRAPLESTPRSGSDSADSSSTSATDAVKPATQKDKPVVRETAPAPSGSTYSRIPTSPSKPSNEPTKKPGTLDPKTVIPPPIVTPPTPPEPDPILPPDGQPPSLDDVVPALPEPKADEGSRRDSLKPVFPSNTLLRARRNVLEGTIVSADSLNPEENVEVVISDRSGRYLDRTTRTNAFGQFAVSLPEGDWTIKVTMPSGRVLAVAQGGVTASAGKIIDMYGRDLKNLVIKR